jgi:hypothetical protein
MLLSRSSYETFPLKSSKPCEHCYRQSCCHNDCQQICLDRPNSRPARCHRLPRLLTQHDRAYSRVLLRATRSNRRLGSLPSDISFTDGSCWCGARDRWRSHSNHWQPNCRRGVVSDPDRRQILGRGLTRQNRSIDRLLVFLLCASGESWKEEESHEKQGDSHEP